MTDAPQTRDALIEALADIEHQRWSDWQEYLHSQCYPVSYETSDGGLRKTGSLTIPATLVEHWERLIATPYADLPEHSKQADRDEVMKIWPLVVKFVADWLNEHTNGPEVGDAWREEMA